jgi:hypothetical protein
MSLATGGRAIGRDFDEVEIGLGSQAQGVLDADDANLLPIGSDQTHLGDPDALVDTRLADVVLLHVGHE